MSKVIKQTSINSIMLFLLIMTSGVYPASFDVLSDTDCKNKLDASLDEATKTNICKGIKLRSLALNGCAGRLKKGRCQPQDSEGLSTVSHLSKLPPPGLMTASNLKSIIPAGSNNTGGVLAGSEYRAYTHNNKISFSFKASDGKWHTLCSLSGNNGSCSGTVSTPASGTFVLRPMLSGLLVTKSKTSRTCTHWHGLPSGGKHCGKWLTTTTNTESSYLWKN